MSLTVQARGYATFRRSGGCRRLGSRWVPQPALCRSQARLCRSPAPADPLRYADVHGRSRKVYCCSQFAHDGFLGLRESWRSRYPKCRVATPAGCRPSVLL